MSSCRLMGTAAMADHATAFAQHLAAGDCIALDGDLGTGKTTWVRGLVTALGGDPQTVSSPTFALVNRYRARFPIAHLDAWRLDGPGALAGVGFDELLEDHLVIVEWAERVAAALPERRWRLRLQHDGPDSRIITIQPADPLHDSPL